MPYFRSYDHNKNIEVRLFIGVYISSSDPKYIKNYESPQLGAHSGPDVIEMNELGTVSSAKIKKYHQVNTPPGGDSTTLQFNIH
jgi:hypothetical protein